MSNLADTGSAPRATGFDLKVTGRRVVTPQGVRPAELGIRDGRIAMMAEPGGLDGLEANRTVDAGEAIVMPGGIDPHVHCQWPMPSPDGGEVIFTGPPSQVSRAALYGGTTTLIDFATWQPGETLADSIARRDADWQDACYCDYAYHLMLQGQIPKAVLEELAGCVQAGYATVKIFTTDITPSRQGRMIRFGDIWEVLKVLADNGGLAVIHAEDNDIVMHMYDKLIGENRAHFTNLAEVHNALSEELSFRRIIRLAENVPGAALYMMHTSAASGVEAIGESRAKGFPIYGETLHQYLMYTADDYARPNGQIYHTYPSLKSQHDQDALWQGMKGDQIHAVATDELCCTLAVKVVGDRVDDTTGGNSGVEPRLAVMYTEMVERRGWSVEKFVDLTSTNAARIMGLHPRKGVLAAGADADITILDPALARTVTASELHETDYTPWEGFEAAAWPAMTIARGKVVMENGEFSGALTDGEYLSRYVDESVRANR
jgi:dihydropyrimidinase